VNYRTEDIYKGDSTNFIKVTVIGKGHIPIYLEAYVHGHDCNNLKHIDDREFFDIIMVLFLEVLLDHGILKSEGKEVLSVLSVEPIRQRL
jgi:hypothetical protein